MRRPAALARLKRPPSRLPIVHRYGYVHRLPYPAVIMVIIARLLGTLVKSSPSTASRKACSSSTSAEDRQLCMRRADKHYHPIATSVLKMTMSLRFIDAYVSCSYQTLLGSASPRTAEKCPLRNIAAE
jgi:hypothetical protein